MSKVLLRVAQVVGVLVLAGLAIGIVVGFLHMLLGIVLVVAVAAGGIWLYKQVSGRSRATPAVAPAGGGRREELEGRAVMDPAGRCGWCGSATLHTDQYGFPTTPLKYHRAEIDAQL
ncbi:hypothetical protein [Pseudonocardia ailaonensis]